LFRTTDYIEYQQAKDTILDDYNKKRETRTLPTIAKLEIKSDAKAEGSASKTNKQSPSASEDTAVSTTSQDKVELSLNTLEGKQEVVVIKNKLVTVDKEKISCDINFQYKKVFKPKRAFEVTIDQVYEGFENFSFKRIDYEVSD
jgi:hypothetical protein